MRFTLLSLFSFFLLLSCTTIRSELTHLEGTLHSIELIEADSEEGAIKATTLNLIQLSNDSDPKYGRVVNLTKWEIEGKEPVFQMNCILYATSYEYTTTFSVKIDNEKYLFRDMNGIRLEEESDLVRETLSGQFTSDQVAEILQSGKITILDFGKPIKLNEEEISLLKDFLGQV